MSAITGSLPPQAPSLSDALRTPSGRGAVPVEPEAPSSPDQVEVGERTGLQHAGNAGLACAALAFLRHPPRAAMVIPGLNVAAGAVEGWNAVTMMKRGDRVAAMGHAANSICCLGDFAEDVGRWAALAHLSGPVRTASLAFGLAGGVLATWTGIHEIRQGLALHEKEGLTHLLSIGVADAVSGTSTVAGLALGAAGAPGVGNALLVAATVCDLTSIAVDYLGRRHDQARQPEMPGSARPTP